MGVFRVWEFLDSWGIINFQAGAAAADEGGVDGVPITIQPAGDPTGYIYPVSEPQSLS